MRRAKKLSFNVDLWQTERHDRMAAAGLGIADNGWITGQFQDNVSARVVPIAGRDYGYLRFWSFELSDDDGFLAEVVRLLGELPQDGLIIDLRGNPGGLIWAAERLLQLFTPSQISPTRFSIIASDLTRAMTDAPQNRRSLSPWRRTLLDAIGTGEVYSQSVPITAVRTMQRHRPGVRRSRHRGRRLDDVFGGRSVRRRVRRQRHRHGGQRRSGHRCGWRQRVVGRHAQQRACRHSATTAPASEGRRVHACRFAEPPGSVPPTVRRSKTSASSVIAPTR